MTYFITPPPTISSFPRFLWEVLTLKLTRKHSLLSTRMIVYGALASACLVTCGVVVDAHSVAPSHAMTVLVILTWFFGYILLGVNLEQASALHELSRWECKERRDSVDLYVKEQLARLDDYRRETHEPMAVLRAKLDRAIKNMDDGEGWKKGGRS